MTEKSPVGDGRSLEKRLPLLNSLRGKGWLFTFLLAVYFSIISLVIAFERKTMLESVNLLQSINAREEYLVGLNYAVSRAVVSVRETLIKATLPGFFVREAATPKFASS